MTTTNDFISDREDELDLEFIINDQLDESPSEQSPTLTHGTRTARQRIEELKEQYALQKELDDSYFDL